MGDKYGAGQDPYTYENSNVLINNFNIRDEAILDEAERELSTVAAMDIEFALPPYDLNYLCELHRKLFSDLFSWAGCIRTIDISKGNTRFCNVSYINKESARIFTQLKNDNYLEGLPLDTFIKKMAEYYCDINVLHPFREGNGRTQRVFFEHLAINCGYNLNFSGVTAEEWVHANIHGYHCNYKPMENLLHRCLQSVEKLS